MTNVVLITGVGRRVGRRVAARLAADDRFARVIGVDTVPPLPGDPALGRTEFVRADVRQALLGRVLDQARVQVVVHTGAPRRERSAAIAGLLAGCERAGSLRRLVVAGTTTVYGSGPRDPAVFTEGMTAVADPPAPPARAAAESEHAVRGFARLRPDVVVSMLRLADIVGPGTDSWVARALELPAVPVVLGFDPRLQLLHEDDAVEVLCRAATADHPGVVNVAAPGVITLTQAARWAGRARLPLPEPALAPWTVPGVLARAAGALPEDLGMLKYGRVVDITRLERRVGHRPAFGTAAALLDHLSARPPVPSPAARALRGVQRLLPAGGAA